MGKYEKKTERFVVKRVWLVSYISCYLVYFVVLFAKHLCFCFVRSLTVSFVIDRIESRGADVAASFSI